MSDPKPTLKVRALLIVSRLDAHLEETLARLKAQSYPGLLATVAVPAGAGGTTGGAVGSAAAGAVGAAAAGADDLAATVERIRSILPQATVCQYDPQLGFGAAVNLALESSAAQPRAELLLICSDSAVLRADTTSKLVEQLLQHNAGIVAPKLVSDTDPTRLVSAGFSVDRAGGQIPMAVAGELDQGQHDTISEIFGVLSSCLLVRTDLMVALHGYSGQISFMGEDLDLCWRSHLATAQVRLAPSVAVGCSQWGLEWGSVGTPPRPAGAFPDARPGAFPDTRPGARPAFALAASQLDSLRWRHRLFSMFTCPSAAGLVVVAPLVAVVSCIEAVAALVLGRPRIIRDIWLAWWWNLARLALVVKQRRRISVIRYVSDSNLRRLQVKGMSELKLFWRSQRNEKAGGLTSLARGMADWFASTATRGSVLVWLVILVFLGFGSRHLISRGIPEVGQFAAFPDSPGQFFSQWFSSLEGAGLGGDGFNSIALGFLGFASGVLFGAMGLARTLVILLPIVAGALGMARLLRRHGSKIVGWVGATAYLCLPLPYNALANGSWDALLLFGALPWIVAVVLVGDSAMPEQPVGRKVMAFGLLTAAVTAFVPAALVLVALCVAALAVGSEFLGVRSALTAKVGFLGALVGFVLSLPQLAGSWSTTLFNSSSSGGTSPDAFSLWELVRFATGPVNNAALGWGLLLVAALPLVVVRDVRFIWVVRGWILVCLSLVLAWLGERTDMFALSPEVLLVPAGVGFAMAAGMGLAALAAELSNYRFGWRQLIPVAGVVGLVIMVVPIVAVSFNGRWNMSKHSYATPLASLGDPGYRVLWLGHPDVMVGRGHELTDDTSYALTRGVSFDVADLWVYDPSDDPLKQAIELARAGASNRLGRLLTPMGIRHVVVLETLTPPPTTTLRRPLEPWVLDMLRQQLDMRQVDLREGIVAYENISAQPTVLGVTGGSLANTESFSDAVYVPFISTSTGAPCEPDSGIGQLGCDIQRGSAAGLLPPNSDVYVAGASDNWEVEINAQRAPEAEAFGWAQVFGGGQASETTVSVKHHTPSGYRFLLSLQLILWLAAGLVWLSWRRSPERSLP